MAAKLSGAVVLLLVVVPLSMCTCALLVGVQLGRALERSPPESLGVRLVRTLVRRIPNMEVGGVVEVITARGAHAYNTNTRAVATSSSRVCREPIWDTTSVSRGGGGGGVRGHFFISEPFVASRTGVASRSSSSKHQPYRGAVPYFPTDAVDVALPKTESAASATIPSTQRYYNNHASPKGVISVGPWGGSSGGQPFYMHGASAPHLRSIILYHSGAIHSLACEYILADDYYGNGRMMPNRVAGPWGRPQSFGSRGVRAKIDLASGEHITAVEGTTGHFANVPGVVITSLTFHTSAGRTYGPYGRVTAGSHHFSVPAADGACIAGFWGRSGWLLDAIGVYIKPSCSSSDDGTPAYKKYYYASRRQGPN